MNLTPKQSQILACLALGMTTDEVAKKMKVAVKTVEWHLVEINLTLGTKTRLSALIKAGYIEPTAKAKLEAAHI